MKWSVGVSILIVSLVSFVYTEEEAPIKETERSLGGSALFDGGRNYKRNSQFQPSYQKEVSSPYLHNRVYQNINGPAVFTKLTRPRQKRDAPKALKYNRDGTISLRCRFSPRTCRNVDKRRNSRNKRNGKSIFSVYLKPPTDPAKGPLIFQKLSKPGSRGGPGRIKNKKQTKGKRVFSVRWKTPTPPPPRRRPVGPSNIYTRAFNRFMNDLSPKKGTRKTAKPRGRRAPLRPKIQRRKKGKGKEIFSLYLKPKALNIPEDKKINPFKGLIRLRGRRRPAPARNADIPLACKFKPERCGRKGSKLFSIYYKGFKNIFPKSIK